LTLTRRRELSDAILAAKRSRGLTWAGLAETLDAPVEWSTAALLGQFPLSEDQARAAVEALGLDDDAVAELTAEPMRGALDEAVPTDPTVYRFYEIVQVYGPAIKELIHEEFGDGIMSAINFGFTVRREPNPGGDRVVVTMNGKFLPHEWRQPPAPGD
jgi:cyanate lyase